MLRRGGDVDTNACIVCGVMGALHGAGGHLDLAVPLFPEPAPFGAAGALPKKQY